MGRRPVLILTGPPGVGKSTVAGLLADRAPAGVHLESDRFFSFIRGGHVEPWKPESQRQNEVVMGIVGRAAATYAAAEYLTVVDGIVLPRWFLAPLRDTLQAAGHEVAYVVLSAPEAICADRVAKRQAAPLAEPEVVARLWWQFEDLGELGPHRVEAGERRPEELADELELALLEGSHLL